MSLDSIQQVAASGLANASAGLGVIGQNVANASTLGYAREISTQSNLTAAGQGMGVITGLVGRTLDAALQASVQQQGATVAGLQTRQAALQALDAVQGATASGTDLASLVTAVQTAFATLAGDPSNQTQQQAVVTAAGTLSAQINALSGAIGTQRQAAQDGAVADVAAMNTALAAIGSISDQIVQLQAQGQSTADLQNQRDAAVTTLSALVPVRSAVQANGDMVLTTTSGLALPIHGTPPPTLSLATAALGAAQYYPGGNVPGVMLGHTDVTAQLGGGRLGAAITLRDTTLPTDQAALDGFAQSLASRFDAQGLRLFSDAAGNVPQTQTSSPVQANLLGFATAIQVNPAVAATPSLVRDGTQSVIGTATGASDFTPNPSTGPAGSTTLIERVLDFSLGSQVQTGVAQPATATTGLGASGTLSLPYQAPATLAGYAGALVAAMAQDSASTSSQLTTAQGVQTSLQAQLTSSSGVSVDTEMSNMVTLQNSYSANAKVMSTVQTLWTVLLAMLPAA